MIDFINLPTPHSRWCYYGGGGMDGNNTGYDGGYDGGGGWGDDGGSGANDVRGADYAAAIAQSRAQQVAAKAAAQQAAARKEQARLEAIRVEAARKVAENKVRSQARLAEPTHKQGLLNATNSITNPKNFDPLASQVDLVAADPSKSKAMHFAPGSILGEPKADPFNIGWVDPDEDEKVDDGSIAYYPGDQLGYTPIVNIDGVYNKATPEQKADALYNSMNVAAGHTAKERNESVGYATFGQEMDRIGIINTFFNHTPGLLPGVAVQAKVDFDPNDAKGNIGDYERAGNDYSFNGMEAIGDVLGLGTGIPGVGTLLGNLDNKYTKFGLGSTDKALVDKIGIDGSLKVADNKIKGAKDAADDAVDFVKEDVVDFVKNGLSQLNNPNGLYNPTGYNPDGEGQQNIEIKKSISDFFNIETNPAKITEKTNPAEVTEKTNETPTTDNGLLGRSNFNRIQSQESRLSPSDRFSSGYYAR